MTLEEGKDLMRKCLEELNTRFLVGVPKFHCKMVDKDGCREIEL